jgi:hypothetical protein
MALGTMSPATHQIRRISYFATLSLVLMCVSVGVASAARQSSSNQLTATTNSKAQAATAKKSSTPSHHTTTSSSHKSTSSSASAKTASTNHHSSRRASRKLKSKRARGQQKIDSERATSIQEALIREHYMTGEASGTWDATSEAAMRRYQGDHGWQTKEVPDSRALIQLGLGPNNDHLLNPESAMTSSPIAPRSEAPTPASHTSVTPAAAGEDTQPTAKPATAPQSAPVTQPAPAPAPKDSGDSANPQ